MNDAEDDLRDWAPEMEDVPSSAGNIGANLMPASTSAASELEYEEPHAIGTAHSEVAEGSHLGEHHENLTNVTSNTSVSTDPNFDKVAAGAIMH